MSNPDTDSLPPTPFYLEESSYDAIFDAMVNRPPYEEDSDERPTEQSFAGNMRYIVSTVRPDVFLFTHKSAIPLADSVRAYYEALGMEVPKLGIVNTKDVTGKTRSIYPSAQVFDREVPLLRPLIKGRRVAILDQYIKQGWTIANAQSIAIKAGATALGIPDSARWYQDAYEEDIDFTNLTSVHADQMRRIGHASAQLLVVH